MKIVLQLRRRFINDGDLISEFKEMIFPSKFSINDDSQLYSVVVQGV